MYVFYLKTRWIGFPFGKTSNSIIIIMKLNNLFMKSNWIKSQHFGSLKFCCICEMWQSELSIFFQNSDKSSALLPTFRMTINSPITQWIRLKSVRLFERFYNRRSKLYFVPSLYCVGRWTNLHISEENRHAATVFTWSYLIMNSRTLK